MYFVPDGNATVRVSLDLGSLQSISDADDQRGIAGSLSLDADVQFGVTLSEFCSCSWN